jgi:pimeloyl-ACP methyl ester carboxylesterase
MPPRFRGARPAGALAALAAALLPGPAAAQAPSLALAACRDAPGFRCGTLSVPLDRSAPAGPRLGLAVRVLPARTARRGTLVVLTGGPGQAGIFPGGGLERLLGDAAPGWDVVAVDQRGTGATALRCPGAESLGAEAGVGEVVTAAAACAAAIGPTRTAYTTADSVADVDDLRAARGAPRLTLLGISYGTLVATWYARQHPARTGGLVLDSAVPLDGGRVLDPGGYAAARRALRELCAARACAGVTRNVLADVARLEARLALAPLRGGRVLASGRTVPAAFGGPGEPGALYAALETGDLTPAARALFPTAVAAALRGDAAPLLRLTGVQDVTADPPSRFSLGLLLATSCQEARLPWDAAAAPDDRLSAALTSLAATPASVTAPFARPGADAPLVASCLGWPEAPRVRPPATPPPDVPALVLSGTQDVRTPLEGARAVAAALPSSTLVVARGSGHSVISTRACAVTAIGRFLAGRGVGTPCRTESPGPVPPVPPRALGALRPLGAPGRAGRTVRAARVTLDDIAVALPLGRLSGATAAFRGLRGGTGTGRVLARGAVYRLRGYSVVQGVRVTGTVRDGAGGTVARLRVDGPAAAPARLTLAEGRVRGTAGGRRVDVAAP